LLCIDGKVIYGEAAMTEIYTTGYIMPEAMAIRASMPQGCCHIFDTIHSCI